MIKRILILLSLGHSVFAAQDLGFNITEKQARPYRQSVRELSYLEAIEALEKDADVWISKLQAQVMDHKEKCAILQQLSFISRQNRSWIKSLFPEVSRHPDCHNILYYLNQFPTESRSWIRRLLPTMIDDPRLSINLFLLNQFPKEYQGWVEQILPFFQKENHSKELPLIALERFSKHIKKENSKLCRERLLTKAMEDGEIFKESLEECYLRDDE